MAAAKKAEDKVEEAPAVEVKAVAPLLDKELAEVARTGRGHFTDVERLRKAMEAMGQKYNCLSPVVFPNSVPQGNAIETNPIAIDTREKSKDLYYDYRTGAFALSKVGLDKIAHAFAVGTNEGRRDGTGSGRVDNGQDPNYCRYRASVRWMGLDGIPRSCSRHATCDLRNGSGEYEEIIEQVEGRVDRAAKKGKQLDFDAEFKKAISRQRRYIEQLAESRAFNRAIRAAFGVAHGYSKEDLKKPFVAPVLVEDANNYPDKETRTQAALELARYRRQAQVGIFGEPEVVTRDRGSLEHFEHGAGLGSEPPPPIGADDDFEPDPDVGGEEPPEDDEAPF